MAQIPPDPGPGPNAAPQGTSAEAVPIPVFHWAFFRLRLQDGIVRIERRKDIRNLAIAASIVLYSGFFLITLAGTEGLERLITCGVCAIAPALVALVTSTYGRTARQALSQNLDLTNERLRACSSQRGSGPLHVVTVKMLYGRSRESEITTMLITDDGLQVLTSPALEAVSMSQGLTRSRILLIFAGGKRPFRPLLAATGGERPIRATATSAMVRLDSPFVLL